MKVDQLLIWTCCILSLSLIGLWALLSAMYPREEIDYKIKYLKPLNKKQMSTARKNLLNVITMIVLALTTFQGLIPTIPIQNTETINWIGAIIVFLVTGFTAWKQYLATTISNRALTPTLVIFIISVLGGVIDVLDVVVLSDIAEQWIRFGVTFITMVLNLSSKVLYPADGGLSSR